MEAQSRMLKTLACLVAAMTGTTALLGWIDPSPPAPSAELTPADALDLARSLVNTDVEVRPGQWRGIQIAAGPPLWSQGNLLAATAAGEEPHFYVDESGRAYRAGRWTSQQATAAGIDIVAIRAAWPAGDGELSAAQWTMIDALIAALDTLQPPGHPELPVLLSGPLATSE